LGKEGAIKRRVLHVYQDFFPKRGGIEDHILTLAQAPSDRHEHIVLVAAGDPVARREIVNGVTVIRAATYGRYYTPFCPSMPRWIKRLHPDIVHLHHPCPMAYVACLLARPSALLVLGHHNDIVKPRTLLKLYLPLQQAVMRRASTVLVGTQNYLDTSPHLVPFRAKCRIVPYGIPLHQFTPSAGTESQAARIRRAHPGPIILFVGRLCYYKGLDVAIDAMQDVDGTLLIVGRGPLADDVRQRIENLCLTHKVVLVGSVDDASLVAHYRACDLTILPSTCRSEAFGLVMLQAHACARPVICSDLPGLSTVNVDHRTGLLVPPGDADGLASAINRLLHAPALRRRMGRAGRRQVEQLYSADRMVRRIEEVYDSLAG
jgi:glycosyltransferase involved in cell wall biosynthesis